jgi:hypothetical protein
MDPKQVRRTIDNLLADLVRNPSLGRPQSFMGRYGRPLGLGLALGIGSVAGCSSGSENRDALPAAADAYGADSFFLISSDARDGGTIDTRDALPGTVDIYGATVDSLNLSPDSVDGAKADTRDALPILADAYGIVMDLPPLPIDAADGAKADTRDALPLVGDAYGIMDLPLRVDTADVLPPAVDGSPVDRSPVDTDNKG